MCSSEGVTAPGGTKCLQGWANNTKTKRMEAVGPPRTQRKPKDNCGESSMGEMAHYSPVLGLGFVFAMKSLLVWRKGRRRLELVVARQFICLGRYNRFPKKDFMLFNRLYQKIAPFDLFISLIQRIRTADGPSPVAALGQYHPRQGQWHNQDQHHAQPEPVGMTGFLQCLCLMGLFGV
jgi:hypothetical protein